MPGHGNGRKAAAARTLKYPLTSTHNKASFNELRNDYIPAAATMKPKVNAGLIKQMERGREISSSQMKK